MRWSREPIETRGCIAGGLWADVVRLAL